MRRIAVLPLLAAALAAGGCGGSFFQSKTPPPTVYLLSAAMADDAAAPAAGVAVGADLAVLKPRVRLGLNTDRIAASYPDRRLDYYAGARWGGPLDEVVQDLALQQFQASAGLRNVTSDGSAFLDGYWLEISVEDFQAEYGAGGAAPTVAVRLRARVGSALDRQILGQFVASARQAAADNRLAAIVAAYAEAANSAMAQIVAATTASLRQR